MVSATGKGQAIPEFHDDEEQPSEALQFPSLAGDPQSEVAKRTADTDKDKLSKFVKQFVILFHHEGDNHKHDHEANLRATLQEAIQRGLHPKGQPTFDSEEEHPDGVSSVLTYSVKVQPAVTDEKASDSVTPTSHKADEAKKAQDK